MKHISLLKERFQRAADSTGKLAQNKHPTIYNLHKDICQKILNHYDNFKDTDDWWNIHIGYTLEMYNMIEIHFKELIANIGKDKWLYYKESFLKAQNVFKINIQ